VAISTWASTGSSVVASGGRSSGVHSGRPSGCGGNRRSRDSAELPLYLLTRRVHRAVEVVRSRRPARPGDVARLIAAGLSTAARLAQALDAVAVPRPRDAFGRPATNRAGDLDIAWLSAATYVAAVATRTATDRWLAAPVPPAREAVGHRVRVRQEHRSTALRTETNSALTSSLVR